MLIYIFVHTGSPTKSGSITIHGNNVPYHIEYICVFTVIVKGMEVAIVKMNSLLGWLYPSSTPYHVEVKGHILCMLGTFSKTVVWSSSSLCEFSVNRSSQGFTPHKPCEFNITMQVSQFLNLYVRIQMFGLYITAVYKHMCLECESSVITLSQL